MGQQFSVQSRLMFIGNACYAVCRIRLEMKIVQPLPAVKGCTRVIHDVLEKRDLLDLLEFAIMEILFRHFLNECCTGFQKVSHLYQPKKFGNPVC